jgi:alginate O-acetyltransferase complex protein AlgI
MIFFEFEFVLGLFLSAAIFWLLVPEKYRTSFLVLLSGLALASLQVWFTCFLMGLISVVYLCTRRMIAREGDSNRLRLFLLVGTLLVIVLLGGKYAGVIVRHLFASENSFSQTYLVPLGISYLVFKLIAFVFDVYRGIIKDPKLSELLAFILFIPAFPAGPIERYQNFANHRKQEMEAGFLIEGLRRLAFGYFKKVVIANLILHELVVRRLQPLILEDNVSLDLPASTILLYLVGALLYAYIDLSAYADIAIGYGRLFGYTLMENMRFPIFQSNLSDYWNRWHISLSSWCRSNVYFPVLASSRNNNLALYSSFVVMGLWHNVSLNWLLWGLWHATGITVFSKWTRFKKKHKKKLKGRVPKRVSRPLAIGTTILYSSLGFSFIMLDTHDGMLASTSRSLRLLAAIFL